MKKYLAILMAAMLLLSLSACSGKEAAPAEPEAPAVAEPAAPAEAEVPEVVEVEVEEAVVEAPQLKEIALGTSHISMSVPADYEEGEMSTEDTDESQVAYYHAASSLVDFDVYHWALADGETLEAAAEAEAEEYGAELAQAEYNGIAMYFYNALEESEGEEYTTASYLMEDNGYVVELVFWLDGETAEAEVEAMLATLQQSAAEAETEGVIALGTSSLSLKPEKAYVAGELSEEDTDESQVGYFYSEDSLVDFDVYHWAKADGETLEAAAKEEAAEYEAELKQVEYNGIAFYVYNAEEENEGTLYNTATYLCEDGDYLVELVFWLDGENPEAEVEAILSTIAR